MRLVVDRNVLVAEALRTRGRALLGDPALDLFITANAWGETHHELHRRASFLVDRGVHTEAQATAILNEASAAIAANLTVATLDSFDGHLGEATWRIPRDHTDAPTVALALALECGIWTNDRDFFGCGLPIWSTEVLRLYLEHESAAS